MRASIAVFIVGVTAIGACSGSGSGGTTMDQSCADLAKSRCAKTQECSTYFWQVRYGGDQATCEAREKSYCLDAFAAPSTGKTVATTEACVAAYATYGCADWLAANVPAACIPKPGGLANAATCAFDGQCQSGFCDVPQNFGCGKCAPPTKVGDSCASGGVCATEATGQYCASASLVCTTPAPRGSTCDGANTLCIGGLTCAGLTQTSNGTCQPAVTTLGADCVPTTTSGAGCDIHHGLHCDAATKKCVTTTFATDGQPCGVVNGYNAYCAMQGVCRIPMGQKAGTCVAVAADGAACDTANGPGCAYRSQCVLSTGTTGTCQPVNAASCH